MTRLCDVQTFIRLSKSVICPQELDRLISDISRDMGFDFYALIHHVDLARYSPDLEHLENGELLALWNYPESWVEIYQERNIVANDPVLMASQRTNVGFAWDDIEDLIKITPAHRAITEDTRRAGLANGFTVPANVPGELKGSCSFAVKTGRILPEKNLIMAQAVGAFAFQAARAMVAKANMNASTPPKRLGDRQLECIALMARGKSDWEIGSILGIAENTVRRHIALAKKHYDVASRFQIAMRAIFEEKITIYEVLN